MGKSLNVRYTDAEMDELELLALKLGIGKAKLIRKLIVEKGQRIGLWKPIDYIGEPPAQNLEVKDE